MKTGLRRLMIGAAQAPREGKNVADVLTRLSTQKLCEFTELIGNQSARRDARTLTAGCAGWREAGPFANAGVMRHTALLQLLLCSEVALG